MSNSGRVAETPLVRASAAQRQIVLDDLEAAWNEFLAALGAIPERDQEQPGVVGTWSVEDLIGHIAAWDRASIGACLAAAPPLSDDAIAGFNARAEEYGAMRSLAAQRAELAAAHGALVAALREAAARGEAVPGTCACGHHAIADHYREHAADLRAWRDRR